MSLTVTITTDVHKPLYRGAHPIVDYPMEGPVYRMNEFFYRREQENSISNYVTFIHDDVDIPDMGWREKMDDLFLNPKCMVAAFGGATSIGTRDLYRTPYQITQLVRHDYASNQTDWQVHGKHFTGSRKVAVLDGFLLAIRWEFLKQIGGFGWMLEGTRFHCYDLALCLEAWRRGWEVWQTGVKCFHRGGGTSCSKEYVEWCERNNTTPALEHSRPHEWLYSRYQDLLPFEVPK